MRTPSPTVSVLVPTYNRAALLKQAIDSVLLQTFGDFELVVSDNASTDHTEELVKSYSDQRIVYSRSARNIGWHGNMNRCLALAKGEYLTFLPDDDLMMPENLERKVDILRRYPNVGMVHSRFHMIDQSGKMIRESTNWGHGPERNADAVESGHVFLKRMLTGYCEVNLPTALFRKAVYVRLGGFTDGLSHADDFEYWMRLAVFFDIAYLASPLIKWRWHAGSLTSHHVKGETTGVTGEGLREQLLAKRIILNRYWREIPESETLRRAVLRETRDRVVLQADVMMDNRSARREARAFLFKMCLAFPELCLSFHVWKTFLKTVLSRRSAQILKALCRL